MFDMATHLLAEVYDALQLCYTVTEACPQLAAYVTLGLGDDGVPDALTVATTRIDTSPASRAGSFGLWRVNFAVILKESGWPIVHEEGGVIVLPSPTLQAAAAAHVYAMGEAMHRKLANLYIKKNLAPTGVACSSQTLDGMFPLPPRGGVVGWQASVTADLPWN